jgi:hypothetical protein
MEKKEEKDPREVELAEINRRLQSVMHLLKNNHTVHALDEEIRRAHEGLGDDTDVFIYHEAANFQGSRHLQSLLRLENALDTKVLFNGRKDVQTECVRLLERKIELVRELHGV